MKIPSGSQTTKIACPAIVQVGLAFRSSRLLWQALKWTCDGQKIFCTEQCIPSDQWTFSHGIWPFANGWSNGNERATGSSLLREVTGALRPGVLTALMRVRGAGKTTLMDVPKGRKTMRIDRRRYHSLRISQEPGNIQKNFCLFFFFFSGFHKNFLLLNKIMSTLQKSPMENPVLLIVDGARVQHVWFSCVVYLCDQ